MAVKIISTKTVEYYQKAPHPLQAWEWGEAREKMGIEVLRLGEYDRQDNLINVFQLTFHQVPYSHFKIGYLPRSVVPSAEVIEALKNEGKKRNCIFIKLEPYESLRAPHSVFYENVKESPHPLFPQWTQLLDLTKSDDELLAAMKPKTRYNIGLAKRKGITIREMTDREGFDIFAEVYFATCRRQKYRGHNLNYHKIVFETLKDKIAHIFVAFYNNTPLSAFEIFMFKETMYYPYGGSSTEHRNLMAPNLLMWEIIRFGKKKNMKTFDMWGSLPPGYPDSNPWAGFSRFKEGYGTEFVKYVGSFDLVINPVAYPLYNLADKLRKRLI